MHLIVTLLQAALDLLADLMTNNRECLKEGLVLLVRLTFALEPQQDFKWRTQPEAIIRCVSKGLCAISCIALTVTGCCSLLHACHACLKQTGMKCDFCK